MQMEMPGNPWQVRQTKLEIDLGLLKKNYFTLLKRASGAELLILLKCDAYGHSHSEISKALDELPAKAKLHGFGVANVEEGIELRRVGIRRPIYVLSGVQQYNEEMQRCFDTCRLIPVISSLPMLKQFASVLKKTNATRSLHLKFNTGMNRLGIDLEEIASCIKLLEANRQVKVDGLMSHFASAEQPLSSLTRRQVKAFRSITTSFQNAGFQPKYLHMENSAGLAGRCYPEGNLSRVGLHIYGVGDSKLEPIARWTAQIYQVRELKKGDPVGYGAKFRAKKKMKMAVLGVGYGDGYRRRFSNRAEVLVNGKRCKVIGSVSMDLTAIDISGVKDLSLEDRAVLLGRDGKDSITAEELATHAGTIPWEILTGISSRVPRVFVNG